jgi:hypothetical protein
MPSLRVPGISPDDPDFTGELGNYVRAVLPTSRPVNLAEDLTVAEESARVSTPQEGRVTPAGLVLGPGVWAFRLSGSLSTALNLRDGWKIELYVIGPGDLAIGTVQLTQTGPFSKLLAATRPGLYKVRVYSTVGRIANTVAPDRDILDGDFTLDDLTWEAERIDLLTRDEVPSGNGPQGQGGRPG